MLDDKSIENYSWFFHTKKKKKGKNKDAAPGDGHHYLNFIILLKVINPILNYRISKLLI